MKVIKISLLVKNLLPS